MAELPVILRRVVEGHRRRNPRLAGKAWTERLHPRDAHGRFAHTGAPSSPEPGSADPFSGENRVPLDQAIYIAEGAMARGGLTGRKWHTEPHRYRDEDGRRIQAPPEQEMTELAREATGDGRITVVATDYFGRGGDTVHASTDLLNTINVRYDTDELTLLHECAHVIYGKHGHTPEFARIAHRLYREHLGEEAARAFWNLVEPWIAREEGA